MKIGDIVILFDGKTLMTVISDDSELWKLRKSNHNFPFCDLEFAKKHCTVFHALNNKKKWIKK